jgi:hypothetical protein
LENGLEVTEATSFVEWISTPLTSDFPFVLPEMSDTVMVLELGSNGNFVACKE